MYLSKFQNVFAKHCNPNDKETGGAHRYVSKYHKVFVQISKCICPICIFLSKLQDIFVRVQLDDVQLMLSINLLISTGLIIPVGQFPLSSSCLVTLLRLLRPRRHNFFGPVCFSSFRYQFLSRQFCGNVFKIYFSVARCYCY